MPLCTTKKRNKCCPPAQKVVIPKGMINPNETTIIEIPSRLHKQPVVVAKRKDCREKTPSGLCARPSRTRSCSPSCSRDQPSRTFNPASHSTPAQGGCAYAPPNCMQQSSSVMQDESNVDLEVTEEQERMQLKKDLEAFQRARRKLLESASKFGSQAPNIDTGMCGGNVKPEEPDECEACCRSGQMIDPRYDQAEYSRQMYRTL